MKHLKEQLPRQKSWGHTELLQGTGQKTNQLAVGSLFHLLKWGFGSNDKDKTKHYSATTECELFERWERINTSWEHWHNNTLKWRGFKQEESLFMFILILSLDIIRLILFITRKWSLESKWKKSMSNKERYSISFSNSGVWNTFETAFNY